MGGQTEGAVASGRRELSPLGREGAGQAHPGLVCSCLTGRGRPGPRHPRAPCAQPGGSEDTEGSGVTQHPSLFPGICSLGLPPSQPTPAFHASLAPPPVTAPTSESHPSFSVLSTRSPQTNQPMSFLQGQPRGPQPGSRVPFLFPLRGPLLSPTAAFARLTWKGCSLRMSTRSRTQAAPSSPRRLRSRTGACRAPGPCVCRNSCRQVASDPCR